MPKIETLNNPIVEQRADPWVYKHTDGSKLAMKQVSMVLEITALQFLKMAAKISLSTT